MRKARQIRESRALTLDDVHRLTSITSGHLGKFERGEVGLSIEKLMELRDLYGCTIDDLLDPAEPAPAGAERE